MPLLRRLLSVAVRFLPPASASLHAYRPCPRISSSSRDSNFRSDSLWPCALFVATGSFAAWHGGLLSSEESRSSGETLVQGCSEALPSSFIAELRAACGDEGVVLDSDERFVHSRALNNFYPVLNIPDVVVYPRSQEEVAAIVKACNKYKIPIVPYGGATSLEGQILATHGGVSVDMNLMKKIKALHVDDMDVIVEPGLGWIELNEYLKPHGLFFPLDPGPGASIGGMCATRCSGSLAVRYGTMRDNVLSLKAVLANGDVIKTANRPRKSAAGYDLTRLMIGSEGTLGVITEVTLRLQKIPEASIVTSFETTS